MNKKIRYTLGKRDRLKSRKIIEQLFKEGRSVNVHPLRILFIKENSATDNENTLQAGFTVSSRHFKHATDRNSIRRLMKEAYRLQNQPLRQHLSINGLNLFVFIIYVAKDIPEYKLVAAKTSLILQRLIELTSDRK